MKRNILSLLLAVLLLTGCQAGEAETLSETDGTTPMDPVAEVETEAGTEALMDDLGEFDFGGYTYRVMSCESGGEDIYTFFDQELTGEILGDSLYLRNREIEERFNIQFESAMKPYGDTAALLRKTVESADNAYDMIMLINDQAFTAALDGMVIHPDKLVHLNPEKPYYLHMINNEMSIGGRSLFYYTEESLSAYEYATCVVYNKSIAADYGLGDYYDLVREGKWTIDKLYADAELVTTDTDGNGVWDQEDQYGLNGCPDTLVPCMWMLGGEKLITKDENDIPAFTAITNERFVNMITRFQQVLDSGYSIFFKMPGTQDFYGKVRASEDFTQNMSLFMISGLGQMRNLREMEADFGIIPLPKYDDTQTQYYSRVEDAWLHLVPVTQPDPERTSVILEALGSATARYVIPAYYDQSLANKVFRDEESCEMLEIVRNNRILDMGECPWYDYARRPIEQKVFLEQSAEFMSLCTSLQPALEAKIAEAVEALVP